METVRGSIHEDVFGRLKRRPQRRRGFALRMAPMIDMVFLLLIFFLVTARWRPEEDFLPLQLAAAKGQDIPLGRVEPLELYVLATPTGCRVKIGRADEIEIADRTIDADLAVMIEKIESRLLADKRFADDPIEIIFGPDVKWEHQAKIYNVLFGTGLADITFRMTE